MKISFDEIDICDLIIVELSEKGVGVGIEAGYAYARQIPIITLARQGSDISATLHGISSTIYAYPSYDALDRWLSDCPLITEP
jgi:nucleoside 2-deoxyribosyltransferase